MSNSTTQLDLIQSTQAQKEVTANALLNAASNAMTLANRIQGTAGLIWAFYGGQMWVGGVYTLIANGTLTLAASATNYVEFDSTTGVVSSNTTAFTVGRVLLYRVVTGASTITSWIDYRSLYFGTPLGSMAQQNANAVAITGGTIDGTAIGQTTQAAMACNYLRLFTGTPDVGNGNYGTIYYQPTTYPAGTTNGLVLRATAAGNASASDFRTMNFRSTMTGSTFATNISGITGDAIVDMTGGSGCDAVAGSSVSARSINSAPVNSAAGYRSIIIIGGSGNITNSYAYEARAVSRSSTGVITNSHGLWVDNQGLGAGTSAYGVRVLDQSGSTNNYGVASAVTSGSNKWEFYGSGGANSAFAGNVRIGSTTAPTVALDVTGSAAVSSLVDISGAAAGQIKFPATQNASSNVNTLDDYEEGTFTPTITFGGAGVGVTYTANTLGRYTKIGRLVSIYIRVQLTSKGSSTGAATINGLPFTVNATQFPVAPGVMAANGAGLGGAVVSYAQSGNTFVGLKTQGAAAEVAVTDANFTNTSDFVLSCVYEAAT
jgi:hypothetical protein